MARKTAIRITNAQIGAADARSMAHLDASAAPDRTPSTLDILRAAREIMPERELLKLARSAARLEMRGASFDAEDRADCAAEIVWTILAHRNGTPPTRGSNHATLGYMCGLARNYRRALKRRRAAEDRAREAREDAYAMSPAAVLDEIEARTYTAEYLAAGARQVSASICATLDLPTEGATFAAIYQWARDATEKVCAAENGCGESAWKMRVKRGREHIRYAFPTSAELIDALRSEAPPAVYRPVRLDWRDREGTAAGAAPIKPETAEDARELCLTRHQCPVPGLAEIGRARLRRGYFIAAPMVRSAGETAPRGYIRVPGRSLAQVRADSLREIARQAAMSSHRERGVSPADIAPHGIRG